MKFTEFPDRMTLEEAIRKSIPEVKTILDLGCGIRPFNWFYPQIHILNDIHDEYTKILAERFANKPEYIILNGDALETLKFFTDNSVEFVVMLDFLEHIEKSKGIEILEESTRVCSRGTLIFTPWGFVPQHYEEGELDGYGLNGQKYQTHISGWLPEDFISEDRDWKVLATKRYHMSDHQGKTLDEPYGALYALYLKSDFERVEAIYDLSRFRQFLLPHEIQIQEITKSHESQIQEITKSHESQIQEITKSHESQIQDIQHDYLRLVNSKSWRMTAPFRWITRKIRSYRNIKRPFRKVLIENSTQKAINE